MKIIKTYQSKDNTKKASIVLSDEIFVVEFYENNKTVGIIEYPNKAFGYVDDAAENWANGVMTRETIDHYTRAA